MKRNLIDPLRDIGIRLLEVSKPARYLGGEAHSIHKREQDSFDFGICFPDLYEIGMSNNAIRIIYDGLNRIEGICCERVFAPAPDFEALLKSIPLPLYTLESGIPIHELDMLGFSLGYELSATNVLCVLEAGKVPILSWERDSHHPIVIAGGPAITNPLPFSAFFDAVYIGEAEGDFFEFMKRIPSLKKLGATRDDLLTELRKVSAFWMPPDHSHSSKPAHKATYPSFSLADSRSDFPVPLIRPIHDHGTVEIMRGCPNGCRFCHAGYLYRPQRCKSIERIHEEVENLIFEGGHREITLASLSSGDYPGIAELLLSLNETWKGMHISFQLPSLKVNSFTLPIIKELAEVRKSGLTFAVETPIPEWQHSINKEVSFDAIVGIIAEAKKYGFRTAKFYFMIGLPLGVGAEAESEAIVQFFERLLSTTSISIHLNLGCFVPKPHTPYQWSAQLNESDAHLAIRRIREGLRRFRNLKISFHDPFKSILEGIIARGDERVGALLLAAYRNGARLDAWEEHFDAALWRSILLEADWDSLSEASLERDASQALPWADVRLQVSQRYFAVEHERSIRRVLSKRCEDDCSDRCGACQPGSGIHRNKVPEIKAKPLPPSAWGDVGQLFRMVFKYSKTGKATYFPHHVILDSFCRAFIMARLPIVFSEGFNPIPKIETTQPIPIAIASFCEYGSIYLRGDIPETLFIQSINRNLPEGLQISSARSYEIGQGSRRKSLASISWGSRFSLRNRRHDSDLTAHEIAESLKTEFARHAQTGVSISVEAPSVPRLAKVRITAPNATSKDSGLFRMLSTIAKLEPIQASFEIEKEESFAHIDNELLSYFDCLDRLMEI